MNKNKTTKEAQRKRRQKRVRAKVMGTQKRPRLNVRRSLSGMYVQLIDDVKSKTLVSLHSKTAGAKGDAGERTGKVAQAYLLGKMLAEKAVAAKIKEVVFDRAGYKFHGRVKALADGAKDGGLKI